MMVSMTLHYLITFEINYCSMKRKQKNKNVQSFTTDPEIQQHLRSLLLITTTDYVCNLEQEGGAGKKNLVYVILPHSGYSSLNSAACLLLCRSADKMLLSVNYILSQSDNNKNIFLLLILDVLNLKIFCCCKSST